ncbi:hypothetical protein CDAR_619891 [Caerostris darwini]|uniref:Anticodon-binding domain-containing protein n=1 Tax=Caerostris darwini TaxID=1538125 RepID=A0AAV4VEE7_9ARAC|nr:hypothetical protein CDAR_619891 [Caerostris darwini]
MPYYFGIQPGKDKTISLDISAVRLAAAAGVKVFRQLSNSSTGSKRADKVPQLEEQNNQYSPLILIIGNEREPQNLEQKIATQEKRKEIFGEIPQHLEKIV